MDTRTQIRVRDVEATEYPRAAQSLASAFQDDSVISWWISDSEQRTEVLAPFFELALEVIYGVHEAVYTANDLSSVSIWVPQGEWKFTEDQLDQIVPVFSKVLGGHLERALELLSMTQEVHPNDPHWYLPFIGTRPQSQAQGLGSALLSFTTERLDRERLAAYLEASSERNRALYLRHGFEDIGRIQIPDGPVMFRMWRDPR